MPLSLARLPSQMLVAAVCLVSAVAMAQDQPQVAAPSKVPPLTIPFTLSKPGGEGPFPAIVLLHDCSGLGPRSSGAPARWSAELVQQGYVTIRPDSFSTRGHPDGVCLTGSPPGVRLRDRAVDAYSALRYLQTQAFVDPNRIGVMGGSHGGASTLATILALPFKREIKQGFTAALAFYPTCGIRYGEWDVVRAGGPGSAIKEYVGVFEPLAPLLILTGELDDWTPAESCRQLAGRAKSAGFPVDIKVYPGAHHAFDSRAPLRFVAERMNMNREDQRGATTGGNQEAWDGAKIEVREFFARYLKTSP